MLRLFNSYCTKDFFLSLISFAWEYFVNFDLSHMQKKKKITWKTWISLEPWTKITITNMWRRWAHLTISVWYLLVNLKNNYLLKNCWSGTIKNVRILVFLMLYLKNNDNKKSTWRHHYFTPVYETSWWYDQFLRYRVWDWNS